MCLSAFSQILHEFISKCGVLRRPNMHQEGIFWLLSISQMSLTFHSHTYQSVGHGPEASMWKRWDCRLYWDPLIPAQRPLLNLGADQDWPESVPWLIPCLIREKSWWPASNGVGYFRASSSFQIMPSRSSAFLLPLLLGLEREQQQQQKYKTPSNQKAPDWTIPQTTSEEPFPYRPPACRESGCLSRAPSSTP